MGIASSPAVVACVGMVSIGGVLMQTGCGPAPTAQVPSPSVGGGQGPALALSVQTSSQLMTGEDGSCTARLIVAAWANLLSVSTPWSSTPSTGVTIVDGNWPEATAVFTAAGTYVFSVDVEDVYRRKAVGTTIVTVPPLSVSANSPLYVSRTQTATLTATTTGGIGAKTFAWTKISGVNGDPATPFAAATTVPTTVLGRTYYRVTVTDSATPPSTATGDVTVFVVPLVPIVTAFATLPSLTLPSTSTLSCTVTEGGPPYTFFWFQAGGSSPAIIDSPWAQNTVVRFSDVGTYTFHVVVTSMRQDYFDYVVYDDRTTSLPVTVTVTSTSPAFTTSLLDNLVGSSGNDTFTGTDTTLQSSDIANGGDGTDALTISLAAALNATLPTLTSIETINISDVSPQGSYLNAIRVSGLTTLNFLAPVGAETVVNLAAIPAVGISGTNQDVTLGFTAAAVSGSADALTATLGAVTGGTFDIGTSIESANIVSGTSANTITVANGPATVNVSGDQALTLATGAAVTTLNASGMTAGGLTATVANPTSGALTVTGSPAADNINAAAVATGAELTASLGAGDDRITLGADFTDGTDALDGGDGTDTLAGSTEVLDSLAVTAALTTLTNFEGVSVNDALVAGITLPYFGSGVSSLRLAGAINAAHTITVPAAATVTLTADILGNTTTFVRSGTGTTDAMTLVLDGSDNVGNFAFTGVETVTVSSIQDVGTVDGGSNTITGTFTITPSAGVASGTIIVTGDQALVFTDVVTAGTINASAFTGALTVTAAPANAVTFSGGSGVDTVTAGSASADSIAGNGGNDVLNGGAGNDSISGGDGDDTINSGAGDDAVTGGAGADIFVIGTGVGTSSDTITDFSAADTDVITIDVSDVNAVITDLRNGAGSGAVAGGDTVQIGDFANAGAYTAAAGDNIFMVTNTTGINSFADVTLNITLGANSTANGDGYVVMYYDADDAAMVIGIVVDTDSDADATLNGSNDTFSAMASVPMTAAQYAALAAADFAFQN